MTGSGSGTEAVGRPGPAIRVRRATGSDAPAIRRIAHDAWRATYAGLLRGETIEWFLERAYSEERVELRIERHETWVALADGAVALFAETAIEPDRVVLVAIYADPRTRGVGLGTAALGEIVRAHPGLPVAADVLEGNLAGETFYAARGFVARRADRGAARRGARRRAPVVARRAAGGRGRRAPG